MKLRKMTLNINGADRMFICNPENDTLADVIRRIGLTGTKIGCGIGACGACTVILNGKVIRSCTKKISTIEEYSTVLTIEGIGTPNQLHPLQVAFMHLGAVQCGFCTPGFIVSAYGLLQRNGNPSREEIRDWFQKNRNVCRCTGYKQIVDAVVAAAEVMRGERDIEDIKVKLPKDKNYYGTPLVRPAALSKVCGVCDFGDDIELKMPENILHVVMVQPKVAHHAKIKNINISEAAKMPGVYKIVTHNDVLGSNRLNFMQLSKRSMATEQTHVLLAEDRIFHYGDIVALVAADSKSHAREAAKKVTIEWEPLPEYTNYLEAVMPDALRIHDDHPNVWCLQPVLKGEGEKVPEIIEGAPYVVEGSFHSSREPHMSLEGDTVQAYWGDDGMLTVHCKTLALYASRGDIAEATGVSEDKVRVIENPTGASFGWSFAAASYALAAIACIACDDMPVALSMTYEEFMAFSGKRTPSYSNGRLACDKDGMIIAAEWDLGLDHGAYNELGDDVLMSPARFMFFQYNIPNAFGLCRVACVNHAYGTAYRAYGSPQAYTCSEALIDMMAERIGMDPFEFRWKNIARKGDLSINSYPYTVYPMEELMRTIKPYYEKAVKRAKENSTEKIRRGVGLAIGGFYVTDACEDQCTVAIELREDGKFIKYDTWQDQGQGGDAGSLINTLEALKPLGVTPDDIVLRQNDTKKCPDSGPSAASRSHYINGKATKNAADKLISAMRKKNGEYRTYEEMIAEEIPIKYEGQYMNAWDDDLCFLDPNTGVGNPTPDYTYPIFLAEVEVEIDTGKTKVLSMICVDDIGVIGNVDLVKGQAFGGMSHSIGFALSEQYEDVKKHNNIVGAGMPTIKDIPDDFEVIHVITPREKHPFGSSGASEAFQSSGHMAVINAINNACGVRIFDLPASPEKIKEGLEKIAKGEKIVPPKRYFLGSDFYEEMRNIKDNPV